MNNEYGLDFMRGLQGQYTQPNNNSGLWNSFTNGMSNSFNTDALGTLGGIGDLAGGLFSMYQGNNIMGMYEDQLDISKDKWATSKAELEHLKNTRSRLTSQYNR